MIHYHALARRECVIVVRWRLEYLAVLISVLDLKAADPTLFAR
jgi:hypothetical protein